MSSILGVPRCLAITMKCPTCGAEPDQKCRAIQGPHVGQLVAHLHITRRYSWRDQQGRQHG